MLTRQLVCGDKHTLWSVLSDQSNWPPRVWHHYRFALWSFPVGYTLDKEDQSKANKDPDWIKLIGKRDSQPLLICVTS
ncbi:hypothetical protein Bca52824_088579 [Brassica carinata]|uniref:Uncharacterized protein n=1 Tax=Brassica carinata TaxID=52824 RepID=A0A8X7PBN6_BRACI|nr:hypothetical protein Bca52824_088579 [Brassica carinata]